MHLVTYFGHSLILSMPENLESGVKGHKIFSSVHRLHSFIQQAALLITENEVASST